MTSPLYVYTGATGGEVTNHRETLTPSLAGQLLQENAG